jgi:hypothetical protein
MEYEARDADGAQQVEHVASLDALFEHVWSVLYVMN